jgi:hypothetical protein
MAKHPSLIREALRRFDGLKAFGESRHALKAEQRDELRAAGATIAWSHSTGKIHSLGTADTYKRQVLDYCAWAREMHGVRHLANLDNRAAELAAAWLSQQLAEHKSPHTVQMQRFALRMFHADRALGTDVAIPSRRREAITRSRGETAADRRIDPARWHALIAFLHATGLSRREVASLRVSQVDDAEGRALSIWVPNGKGGKARTVIVLFGAEDAVRQAIAGKQPEDKVFERIPVVLDVHACRRSYAQALYQALSGRPLPPATGRLPPGSYDRAAVEMVSWSLGHRRTDVVLRHYLR